MEKLKATRDRRFPRHFAITGSGLSRGDDLGAPSSLSAPPTWQTSPSCEWKFWWEAAPPCSTSITSSRSVQPN